MPLLPPEMTATLSRSLLSMGASPLAEFRQDTDLLQELHHGYLSPMLTDLSVLEAVDVNLGPGDAFVRGLLAHHRALVRRYGGTSLYDPVA